MEKRSNIWGEVQKYFSVKGFLTSKSDVEKRINDGISFIGPNLWVLVFAILIASLGLNINSTAVIIGAMLISPLMGPIIGMGYSVGTNDFELFKKSLKNYIVATLISLVTAAVYFAVTPYRGAQSELLARTSPTIYDVLIALCGGAAGIVALGAKDRGNILPGVAIATALMPPLCTAGFGIASLSLKYFLGAFYLYFINTVFIALATFIGVRAMKFRRKADMEDKAYRNVRRYIIAIVIITMVPAVIMTVNIISESIFDSSLRRFVSHEMNFSGTQIISQKADRSNKVLTVAAVGKEIPQKDINDLNLKLPAYGMAGYTLNVIQGNLSDSIINLNNTLSSITATKDELTSTLSHQNAEINELKGKLSGFTKYETLTKQIIGEIQSFYPGIKSLSIFPSVESGKDTNDISRYVSAQILMSDNSEPLGAEDLAKINNYIKSRAEADSVVVVLR
ncbi:MAG: DUF389 domain-containing protein [Bacteroidales bacterium]|nr:DUF389 domain-containing protein [Bacteroidales bacterium]